MNCGPMSEALADITEDAFLGGQLRLRQPKSGHRAGHDAMLLAAATAARPRDRVADFGAGVGAAGLALARRVPSIELLLIEIDPELAELARGNAASNAIAADIIVLDVTASPDRFAATGLAPDSVDVVLMNPPFNDAHRHRASPDGARAAAHVAGPATLEGWVQAARRVLKSGGSLTLIWRADGIADVLAVLQRMGRNPPPAILVRPRDMTQAIRAAMLLGSVIPDLKAETAALAQDLDEHAHARQRRAQFVAQSYYVAAFR